MPINLDESVAFWNDNESYASTERLKERFQYFVDTPEGAEIFNKMQALYGGQKLNIVVMPTNDINKIGFNVYEGAPVIFIDPHVLENTYVVGEHGEQIQMTVDRFFAHEMLHATQADLMKQSQEFLLLKQAYLAKANDDVLSGDVPNDYMNQVAAVKDNAEKLAAIYGKLFDEHYRARYQQADKAMLEGLSNEPVAQRYVAEIEVPALECESAYMAKYFNEPARTKDYLKSQVLDEASMTLRRDDFIAAAVNARITTYQQQQAFVGREGSGDYPAL